VKSLTPAPIQNKHLQYLSQAKLSPGGHSLSLVSVADAGPGHPNKTHLQQKLIEKIEKA
jgi:hypothetical protein